MKIRFRLFLCCLSAMFFLLALGACDVSIDTTEKIGSGKPATQSRALAPFSAIELDAPFNVVVSGQGAQAVEVSGDDNLLGLVETSVRGDTLVVRAVSTPGIHIGVQKFVRPLTVHVVNANLKKIRLSGSGDLELSQYQGERLELEVAGAGDLRVGGRATELAVQSSGSGDIDAHQLLTQRVHARLDGPGDLLLTGVGAELGLELNGSGEVRAGEVRLDKLTVTMNGSGDVQVDGSAQTVRAELGGSGDLNLCGLTINTASAVLRSSGDACLGGPLRHLDAELHGSGNLNASGLQAESVHVSATASGDLTLAGTAAKLRAELSGSGDFEGKDLQAGDTVLHRKGPGGTTLGAVGGTLDIDSDGSGELRAQAAGKSVHVSNRGPGTLHLSGTTELVSAFLSGSGAVDARALLAHRAEAKVNGAGTATLNVQARKVSSEAGASRIIVVDRNGAHPQTQAEK